MPIAFRPVVNDSGDYHPWLLEIKKGQSGVYVIREKGGIFLEGEVLYVGESHTGHLKRTLMRHFQNWEGKTAGNTFDRAAVEVAVFKTRKENAVELQNALIAEHSPRLNVEGNPSWLDKLFGA